MRTSDSIDAIAPAFVAFQADLEEKLPRNRFAEIDGQVHAYADLADYIAAIRLPLAANDLALTQDVTSLHRGLRNPEGVNITTRIVHTSGQYYEWGPLFMPTLPEPWAIGQAITYGCRYAIKAAVNLEAGMDDDAAALQAAITAPTAPPAASRRACAATPKAEAPKLATKLQVSRLIKLGAGLGWDEKRVITETKAAYPGTNHPDQLDRKQISALITALESRAEKEGAT